MLNFFYKCRRILNRCYGETCFFFFFFFFFFFSSYAKVNNKQKDLEKLNVKPAVFFFIISFKKNKEKYM